MRTTETTKIPTLDEAIDMIPNYGIGFSVDAFNEFLQNKFSVAYPEKPKKPHLNCAHNSVEAIKYGNELSTYESAMKNYKIEEAAVRTHNAQLVMLLEEFVKKESGLNGVPEQYRDKVYSKAYSMGHDSGMSNVYSVLCSLIEIFE